MTGPALVGVRIGDAPEAWASAGFAVRDETVQLGPLANGIIRLLGQPSNSEGRNFAVDTFFRNFNDMAPESRNLLFGSGELRKNLDEFAGVMGNLAASKGTRNTSETAAGLSSLLGYGAGGIPGALGQALASYGAAKLWTNPGFVRWATGYSKMLAGAARAGTVNASAQASQMHALGRLASSNSAIAADALGLQQQLAAAFSGPLKAAAGDPKNAPATTAAAGQ